MKLYEITNTYQQFLDALEEGEIPQECISDTLEGLDGVFEEKIDNIACMIKSLEADAEKFKAEISALNSRKKTAESSAEWLRQYVSSSLQAVGKTKMETARNKLSFRKSVKLHLEDNFTNLLSRTQQERFLRYKEPELDKKAITDALKQGEEIAGAKLETGINLQIK